MKLDTEITAKSSVSAPLIILYYSSKANSAVPGQPFTSPRSIAKSSQPTIEIGVEVPILQPMGEDVALYGEHVALEAGPVPRIQAKYSINNPVIQYYVPIISRTMVSPHV